jgi:hypothetical protein
MNARDAVFPIFGRLKDKTDKFIFLGTGFFIDKDGLFVTAGHTFRKNQSSIAQFYISFLKEDKAGLIPIISFEWISKEVFGEFERRDNVNRERSKYQCGPEYVDVAVGKIKISETSYYVLQRKRPHEKQKLISPCYNRNEATCPERIFNIYNNLIDCSFIEFNEKPFKLKNRHQFARVYYMGNKYKYKNIDLFNNCIEVEGSIKKGNSGAPVINEKSKVVGIIVGGEKFSPTIIHLSGYIIKKVRQLKQSL